MDITIKENPDATIYDQLDEQGVPQKPLKVKDIYMLFHASIEDDLQENFQRAESIILNLMEWGVLEEGKDYNIETENAIDIKSEFKVEIKLV